MRELPKGWAEAPVDALRAPEPNSITDGPFGSKLKSSHYVENGPRVVRLGNVGAGRFIDNDVACISEEHFSSLSKHHVAPGDIVVAALGDPLPRACLVPIDLGPALVKADCFRVKPSNHIDTHYVANWFNSEEARDHFSSASHGLGRVRVNLSDLKDAPVPIPPLAEQRRIVAKIDSLAAKSKRACDRLNHVPRLVERYRAAILSYAFDGSLSARWRKSHSHIVWSDQDRDRLHAAHAAYLRQRRGSRLKSTSDASLGEIPSGWLAAPLAATGELQVGYAFKSNWYAKTGVRLLRGANIAPGRIDWGETEHLPPELADEFHVYRLNAGDIVIAMDRPLISSGLKVAIVEPVDDGCLLVQRVARYKAGPLIDQRYAWYLINSHIFRGHAVANAAGSDLPHISSNDILTTPTPLPPLEEQSEIARLVGTAFAWIDRLAAEATSARKLIDYLEQAVLAKAFQGELVPQDPADEPASVLLEKIRSEKAGTTAATTLRGRPRKLATA